ncbi:MAG: TonB-dependent receptor [Acidiferrobacterales bacterium]|nr:TonB-dependent receptor [Acidiferrobacterales bacterium]
MIKHILRERLLSKSLFVAILLTGFLSGVSHAQDTVSGIKGAVTDNQGSAIAGAQVIVRNEDSGLTRTTTTNSAGEYSVRNLPVGNNYSVTVESSEFSAQKSEGVSLLLGQTGALNFALSSSDSASPLEEVVVTGSAVQVTQVAVGPSAVFGLDALEDVPSINRNIADVLRADPRIYVDESRGAINSINCAGKNPRFNSLTVDGVRLNDAFGLNSNGYPTESMPFPYDALNQVSVELAPFDVEYGGFTACNVNSVTKSGGNEFSGSLFYEYTDDGFRGDSLEGDSIVTGEYDEKTFGISIGGPIVEDKLFFFAAFEKQEGANLFDRGAIGSGAVEEVAVSQAEVDEIAQIAREIYQYDPGIIPLSIPNDDEKILLKVDWNINDMHRAALTYNYNDGFNTVQSDGDNNELEFSNHLYERGTELKSTTLALYSNWTDRWSTEFRLGKVDVDNRQETVGGNDFGEIRVELDDVDVYLGGDDSRQSNDLNYDVNTISLKGNYDLDRHRLSFGFEREDLDVFNLFVQHTETEIRFDGIDNFRNGFADAIYYNNAPSNNPTDAAADWGYAINTLFFQDEFAVNDRLTVMAGLRYDRYSSSDVPEENADFVADYGFSNSTNLDGEGLLQPRLNFTFDFSDTTTFTGGLGLYSGGNPNVWLSNNFSANNVLQFGQRGRSFGYTDGTRSLFDADVVYLGLENGVPNGPGYGIPSELYNAVASGVGDNFEINYLDPNFKLPSEWKLALGVNHITSGDFELKADLILTDGKDTAIVQRGDLEQIGTNEDGYPIYDSVREASFVLTNSDVGNESLSASFSVSKSHDNGFDWTIGYAYTDADDISPMTSSVAFSNYQNRAFFDPQEDVSSTSTYQIEHRLTVIANWRKALFGDNLTTVSVYGSANSGRPYSRAYNGTIDPYGFTPYLDFNSNVLEPGTQRNAETGSSWTKVDLKIQQELPGFSDGDKFVAFLTIDNFTNFLNDDWGVQYQPSFPYNVDVDDDTPESRVGDSSRYEIKLGVKYDF